MRSLFLFTSICLGIALPQGHVFAFLIRYLVVITLFLSLLTVEFQWRNALSPRLGTILAMMLTLAGLSAWVGHWFSGDVAVVAFLLAMAPTATTAPVMTELLQGRVDYVTACVVVTTLFSAVMVPLGLPFLADGQGMGLDGAGLANTLGVVLIPLGLVQGLRAYWPQGITLLVPMKQAAFYLWGIAIYLATARATFFIEHETQAPLTSILPIAAAALVLCIVNFSLGRWLGGYGWGQEMGQSLGQKNTLFVIWVCLTFLTPAIALGPTFYILFQNLYNSYLLAQPTPKPLDI